MPQEYFGRGSIGYLKTILASQKPKNIFLVRGKTSYQASGAEEKLQPFLTDYPLTAFMDFSANAKVEDVEKGIAIFRENHCDFIIAVGGGSALDLAKAVALLANQSENISTYLQKKISPHTRTIPLIAIPTTAGTGSEATHFAAIYIDKKKFSLAHPSLIPDDVIIDPDLTFSLPPYITACTGMDALTQAIESYWSVQATTESRQYARQALTLALDHLEAAVNFPTPEARTAMAHAANLSGKAINLSFTTACHAISYPITAYFGVPHGQAVALTLPEMVMYNANVQTEDCLDPRGAAAVQKGMEELFTLFGVTSAEKMKERLEWLMDRIGLNRTLRPCGIKNSEDIELVISNGFNPERVGNNPRNLTRDNLRKIMEKIV